MSSYFMDDILKIDMDITTNAQFSFEYSHKQTEKANLSLTVKCERI